MSSGDRYRIGTISLLRKKELSKDRLINSGSRFVGNGAMIPFAVAGCFRLGKTNFFAIFFFPCQGLAVRR